MLNIKFALYQLEVTRIFKLITYAKEHAVEPLVEALRYLPEGRSFDSLWCH